MSKNPSELQNGAPVSQAPVIIGDPRHLEIMRALARKGSLPWILCFVLAFGNIVQSLIKPRIITAVVSEDGRRLANLDDIKFGKYGPVAFSPDEPSDQDKADLVEEFCKTLYGIDPQARKYQLERAYDMLVPDFAREYFTAYKASGQVDQQRDERWQASWKRNKVEFDRQDRYVIHVIGTQEVTKYLGDRTEREVIQHAVDFRLADDSPRQTRNFHTGFLISYFRGEVISRGPAPAAPPPVIPN
jgi:hypothetical protein